MMTKNLRHLALAAAGLFLANTAAAQGISKFGVVDMQHVILNVEDGKAARAKLEAEIKTKEASLLKKKEELDKLNQEWKNQAPLLSEDARMKKQQEFQEKFLALRNEEMEFQADINRKQQKATQEIAIKVAGVVEKLARDQKLTAVFETNSAGLLYVESPIDLTPEVIKEYAKHPKLATQKPEAKAAKK